jgi:hypothetical protein
MVTLRSGVAMGSPSMFGGVDAVLERRSGGRFAGSACLDGVDVCDGAASESLFDAV